MLSPWWEYNLGQLYGGSLLILTKFANAHISDPEILLSGFYLCEEFRANYKVRGYGLHIRASSLLTTTASLEVSQNTWGLDFSLEKLTELIESGYTHGYSLFQGKDTD